MATEATHESRCPVCDQPIHEGELIEQNADREWCHRDCADE